MKTTFSAREVLAYYNREQYGVNPLFYGPQYDFFGVWTETILIWSTQLQKGLQNRYVGVNNFKEMRANTDDNLQNYFTTNVSGDHIIRELYEFHESAV
jgi:hypothetical protein